MADQSEQFSRITVTFEPPNFRFEMVFRWGVMRVRVSILDDLALDTFSFPLLLLLLFVVITLSPASSLLPLPSTQLPYIAYLA